MKNDEKSTRDGTWPYRLRSVFSVDVCKTPRVWDRARVEEGRSTTLQPGTRRSLRVLSLNLAFWLQVLLRDLKAGAEVFWWGHFQPGRNLIDDTLRCFLRQLVSGGQGGRDPEEGETRGGRANGCFLCGVLSEWRARSERLGEGESASVEESSPFSSCRALPGPKENCGL